MYYISSNVHVEVYKLSSTVGISTNFVAAQPQEGIS